MARKKKETEVSPEEERRLEITKKLNKEQKLFCSNGNKLERALKFKEPILMCVFIA